MSGYRFTHESEASEPGAATLRVEVEVDADANGEEVAEALTTFLLACTFTQHTVDKIFGRGEG